MRLFVQSEAESGKFQEVSRVLHLAVKEYLCTFFRTLSVTDSENIVDKL
jgi:hypothetical protein